MKFKEFCVKKDVKFSLKRYGIDAMSAMAQGLFASLLIRIKLHIIQIPEQQNVLHHLIDLILLQAP